MKKSFYFLSAFFFCFHAHSQNLFGERIRTIASDKKSVFLDRGIFHKGAGAVGSSLTRTRHSFKKEEGYERLVFDFKTTKVPKIYSYVKTKNRKIYIDFFNTTLGKNVKALGNSRYVKGIDYFPLSPDVLSMELSFKKEVSVDMFYLQGANKMARLVIDVKE